jgi:hypothetical protein
VNRSSRINPFLIRGVASLTDSPYRACYRRVFKHFIHARSFSRMQYPEKIPIAKIREGAVYELFSFCSIFAIIIREKIPAPTSPPVVYSLFDDKERILQRHSSFAPSLNLKSCPRPVSSRRPRGTFDESAIAPRSVAHR